MDNKTRRIIVSAISIGLIILTFLMALVTAGCTDVLPAELKAESVTVGQVTAYFCPVDDCRQAILDQINSATTSIHMTMFSFTDDAVGDALVAAAGRGVDVQVYLELGQISKYSEAYKLVEAGIPVRQDVNSAYMHNKYLIIDGVTVMTGSVNYSANGFDENNENLIILEGAQELAARYESDFQRLFNKGIDWLG